MSWEYIVIIGALALAIIIVFLSGFYRVKENNIAIIERMGEFKCLHTKGIYYHAPLFNQKTATYSTEEIEEIIDLTGKQVKIRYLITDVKVFHYSGHSVEKTLAKAIEENGNMMLTSKQLEDTLKAIGIEILKAK